MQNVLALLFDTTAFAVADIQTHEVTYPAGDVTAKGFLAIPEGKGPHPGILVVHEWWGANKYVRDRARQLAGMGYLALAVDMYGNGQTASHPKDAGTFAMTVKNNQKAMQERFLGAMAFLKMQDANDNDRIAAIGYCFGGNVVLQMARNGLDGLDGVASFHGSLGLRTPQDGAKPTAKVLVCNGAEDPFIPAEDIAKFKKTMEAAGIDYTFTNYKDATHGFTNPGADEYGKKFGLPLAYHKEADEKSWAELTSFLEKLFAQGEE